MRISRFFVIPKFSGQLYLCFAIIIFGAANSVTRKLTEVGAQRYVNGNNPVSFCNVLFVGNLCALFVLLIVYGRQFTLSRLQRISKNRWFYLTISAILAGALAPGLIFQALAITDVNNVVLIGRLEPPLTLALSAWLLGERVNQGQIIGAIVSFIGVFLTISLPANFQEMMKMQNFLSFGTGEILTAIASVALAISTIISKLKLATIPLGIFTIYRTALGTVIFFFTALLLYGQNHFMDVFSPFLWKWMLIYGPVIVVIGQSCWITGLRATSVTQASLIGSFTPIAAVIAAYLILGQAPNLAQYIGGFVILIGIIFSQLGILQKLSSQSSNDLKNSPTKLQELESEVGFKGI
ncbi:DMT family transporter [Plectonema cf. radiosum LEGE 06105]|uniref:DMT family transporter n=1 Tax=Plectonema cf. radiosum LEGE 06105 TaxID=945769 RepID=A0A8J7F0F4_9CYAN|nr:DMT family transporter [Plectonema radiosum]MBE9213478.1 DMT family transporter [Plectonema cf. radiosum LEGE 06105]